MIPIPDISQVYPKTGLTLDTRFIAGEGNARDLSGDSNTGTLISGRAVSFDGTGDFIDCGVGMDFTTTGGSFALWVKITSTATGNRTLFETSTTGSNRFALGYSNGDHFRVSWYPGDGYVGKASTTFSQDTWYHLVGTIEGGTNNTTLYLNGVSQNETFSALGISGTNSTAIGAQSAGGPAQFAIGSISGVKAFDVQLTAAQALELYNNPEQVLPTGVSASNLKRFYPLTDFENSSPNSLDGLYVLDCGADKVNGQAAGCGMDRAEEPKCPQLGLMPTASRYLAQIDDSYTITQDSDINALFATGGSISFWVFPFSDGEGNLARIIDTQSGGVLFFCSGESSGNARLQFIHFFDGADGSWQTSSLNLPIGAWSNVVLTYNASDVNNDPVIYVNASSKAITENTTPTGTVNADNSDKIIGNQNGNGRAFDGYISECGMWKTVLDADAVTAIYNSGVQGFDLLSDSGNYDVSSSLKGWWKFNNAFTVQDLTSFNNDATANGSPVLSVIPEGATAGTTLFGNTENKLLDSAVINLDGRSRVQISHDTDLNPTITDGFTVSIWAKMTNLGNGSSTAILQKDSGNSRVYLRIRDDAGDVIQFNFGDGTGTTDVGSGSLSDNNWHHYVIILKTSGSAWTTADQYTDGAIAASGTDISARTQSNTSTGHLTIGGSGTTSEWMGAIAYPKIYKRALSANEVKLLYSSGLRVIRGL